MEDGRRNDCKECKKARSTKWAEENPEKIKARSHKWKKENPEKVRENNRKWREENSEKYKAYLRKWREENRERDNALKRKWAIENKEKINKSLRDKYQNNPQHRLKSLLRGRIRDVVNKEHISRETFELLGLNAKEFKEYFEDQFEEGMTWDNQGDWHIEHIIPCSAFDQENPQHRAVCWHYLNLRPMWGDENISKGSSLPDGMNIDDYVDQTLTFIQS